MRADTAKQIPLTRLLAKLGHTPQSIQGDDVWYCSPFREERTPSFKVKGDKMWYDHGRGEGGNILDFVMIYFELHSISAALAQLDQIEGVRGSQSPLPLFPAAPLTVSNPIQHPPASTPVPAASRLTLKKVQPLQNKALCQYLQQRGIQPDVAQPYLQEAYYTVRGRDHTYFALAFSNLSDGYELRNPYFQGVYGKKAISIISPATANNAAVLVFEGFMDFLSAKMAWTTDFPLTSVLILNSVALKDQAVATIRERGFSDVTLYLDHDAAGRKLTAELQALEGLRVHDGSDIYAGHDDFNDWLQAQTKRSGRAEQFLRRPPPHLR